MKKNCLKIPVLVLILSQLIALPAFSQIGIYEELMSLSRLDLLPQYRNNSDINQISSYDTTGGNDDGFSGKYSYLRKENDGLVIADLKGPGIINRIWTPTPSEDTIQFFFDGEIRPRINIKFTDLFTGDIYPFSRPVVGNEVGGYYCYLPIPYERSCKIFFKGKLMRFIQIDYRQITDKISVTSFPNEFSEKEKAALSIALKEWNGTGKEVLDLIPKDQNEIKTKTLSVSLKPGEISSIFKASNGGRILGIEITLHSSLNFTKDLIFKATWDNDKVPAIDCPLTDFFGYAFGKPSMQSMVLGVKNKIHYCYLPMPYEKKASLELLYLKNDQNVQPEISCDVVIKYSDLKIKSDEGRLYAKWSRAINPEAGKPYTILKTEGQGHYVGTILQAQGLNPGITTFFEGDDECYIDGKLKLHGTGSEDYFNGGWYALPDRWDQNLSLPVHGALTYSIPLARTGGYRFYVSDKISFKKTFLLTIEHGPVNNNIPVDYSSVAFYYCDMPPVENDIPSADLLKKIEPPSTMEYWLALLPINAFSSRATISNERWTDSKNNNYDVMKFSARGNGFIKFELEVPEDDEYRLYMSYFKGPSCGAFQVFQRQIPVSKIINAEASENTFVEKEYIGSVYIKEGTNTITVTIKDRPGPEGNKCFALQKIFLEKKQR